MERRYTVSKDKNRRWYEHMKGYPNITVFGHLSAKTSEDMESGT